MKISHLDHLVLTVENVETTCAFYERVLEMRAVSFGDGRRALEFGEQKINLHQRGHEFEPKARNALPGSADLCFIAQTPLPEIIAHLHACNVEIIEGPVRRSGACGDILSVYFRDPDFNLIEVSNYL